MFYFFDYIRQTTLNAIDGSNRLTGKTCTTRSWSPRSCPRSRTTVTRRTTTTTQRLTGERFPRSPNASSECLTTFKRSMSFGCFKLDCCTITRLVYVVFFTSRLAHGSSFRCFVCVCVWLLKRYFYSRYLLLWTWFVGSSLKLTRDEHLK